MEVLEKNSEALELEKDFDLRKPPLPSETPHAGYKKSLPQNQLVGIIRYLRATLINLNTYPKGHKIIQDCLENLLKLFVPIMKDYGNVTIVFNSNGALEINRSVLHKQVVEKDHGAWCAAHFRDRQIKNIVVYPSVTLKELENFFDIVSKSENELLEKGDLKNFLILNQVQGIKINQRITNEEIEEYLQSVEFQGMSFENILNSPEFIEAFQNLSSDNFIFEHLQKKLEEHIEKSGGIMPRFIKSAPTPEMLCENIEKYDNISKNYQKSSSKDDELFDDSDEATYKKFLMESLASMLETSTEAQSAKMKEWLAEGFAKLVSNFTPSMISEFLAIPTSSSLIGTEDPIKKQIIPNLANDPLKFQEVQENLIKKITSEREEDKYTSMAYELEKFATIHVEKGNLREVHKVIKSINESREGPNISVNIRRTAEETIKNIGKKATKIALDQFRKKPEDKEITQFLIDLREASLPSLIEELKATHSPLVQGALTNIISTIGKDITNSSVNHAKYFVPLIKEFRNNKKMSSNTLTTFLRIVSNIGSKSLEEVLLEYSDTKNKLIENEVIKGLLSIQTDKTDEVLLKKLLKGSITALDDLKKAFKRLSSSKHPQLVSVIKKFLKDSKYEELKPTLIKSLGKINTKESLQLLKKIIFKKGFFRRNYIYPKPYRAQAIYALARLGDIDSIKYLNNLKNDPKNDKLITDAIDISISYLEKIANEKTNSTFLTH